MAQKIRKGDTVQVITGKDRGKRGKVLRVMPKKGRAVVEGVNLVKRHVGRRRGVTQTGIITQEAPIHLSNLMLVCPSCGRAVRVGFRFLEDGRKVRVCKKCGENID